MIGICLRVDVKCPPTAKNVEKKEDGSKELLDGGLPMVSALPKEIFRTHQVVPMGPRPKTLPPRILRARERERVR